MRWHECSLICSDACGCAACHVAPTHRIVMLVGMQARSVHRVRPACQVRWFRHVARACGSPSAQSAPASPCAHQVRKGAEILQLGNFATSGFAAGAARIYLPSTVGIACRGPPGGASSVPLYLLRITRITRPITHYFLHITRITHKEKEIK